MRALHVIPSLSPKHGGPSMALPAMARALAAAGLEVDVATTDDDGPGCRMKDVPHAVPVQHEGFRVFYFPKQSEFYKLSLPLLRWLVRHVADYDVVHVHTVFSFATLAAGWSCRLLRVPFIVRPLGVLSSWGMANRRRWVKGLSFSLLDKPVLNRAAALHYTSTQERDDAARLGLRAEPKVIPLGFDLAAVQSLPPSSVFHETFPQAQSREMVLYLSRLDPKKNVEALLEAFALLRSEAVLVIAGSGEAEHVAHLQQRSQQLGLTERVIWAGHLEGVVKMSAFAAASVYVLPSHSENFGIALLEAMTAGLACVSTEGVALAAEAALEGAVVLSRTEPEPLARALEDLLNYPARRRVLGAQAARLARERYSAKAMAAGLKQMYENCRTR